jgi:hypothetical protein
LSGQRSGFGKDYERTVDKQEWENKTGGGQSTSPTPQRTGKKVSNAVKVQANKKTSKGSSNNYVSNEQGKGERFDLMAQFYPQQQPPFENVYDNINLENC